MIAFINRSNRGLRTKTTTLWLFAWSLIVLAATLLPGDFKFNGASTGREIFHVSVRDFLDILDILLNVLLFVPLGTLLVLTLSPRAWGLGLISFAVGASAFALSFSIEFLQQFLPSRTPSLLDVLSNTVGAVIGVRVWAHGSRVKSQLTRFRRNTSLAIRAGVLAGCSLVALLVSGTLQYAARLSNWDEQFLLLIGNEHTGDRAWRGTAFRVDLSDLSTPEELVRAFAAGHRHDLPSGSIASITFASNTHFEHAVANLPPLVWAGPERVSASEVGLKVTGGTWLLSARPPKQLARRVSASNAFTLRIVCASTGTNQEGPARILSYSIDTMRGNFTVGQEGRDMVLRLRTPITGLNGSRIPIVVPDVFVSNEVRDILLTYSGSTLRAAVAESNQVHSVEFNPGATLATFYLSPLPQYFGYFKVVYYGLVLLLHLGLLAGFTPNIIVYFAVGLPWLATFTFMLEGTLAFATPRPFAMENLTMSFAAGFVALIMIGAILRSAWMRADPKTLHTGDGLREATIRFPGLGR